MTPWEIFWKAVKSFLGWLFFAAVFIFVASLTYGFKAYCPLESFLLASAIVFILMLILGLVMGVFQGEHT